jgi:hypothetical protein
MVATMPTLVRIGAPRLPRTSPLRRSKPERKSRIEIADLILRALRVVKSSRREGAKKNRS